MMKVGKVNTKYFLTTENEEVEENEKYRFYKIIKSVFNISK